MAKKKSNDMHVAFDSLWDLLAKYEPINDEPIPYLGIFVVEFENKPSCSDIDAISDNFGEHGYFRKALLLRVAKSRVGMP